MTQENQQVHMDTPQECCNELATHPTCKGKKVCRYALLGVLAVAAIALIIAL